MGQSLGSQAYKIRWQVKSKGKGRSGGIRVITYYLSADNKLYLLSLYDKSEKESIPSKELRLLIESIHN
ncbi:type II toxin-antitoxin system RelE/ParE family toxin [Dyadobacter sp. CY323]|uniref:type II toxin-antitoxin system RelE/ParE family toxin n=1 Tax=Dyadobacter sp. CY323 TaxID=2907302 RepID=UPI001F44C96D|nr:type II toxin-antitoxin system RelE/ParE family toxin [Dyadobacter sp. CY323]MCE6987875.1 type II toxin-antitoxin system RelE/ParE family toxin [Dyadobacter sp. CY323]